MAIQGGDFVGQVVKTVKAVAVFKLSHQARFDGDSYATAPATNEPKVERRGPDRAKNVTRPNFEEMPATEVARTSLAASPALKTDASNWGSY